MADWKYTIKLGDVFHNENMTFIERRDAIVHRIRISPWFKKLDEFDDAVGAVEELSDSENLEDFDIVWAALYEIFNADLVWIDRTTPRLGV